ncbi:hypothetical protein SAMN05444279_1273 [Ruegeria intermedia]|uniref:Uncharacterized protein n=1 Tax=Ruegeria intermedia TaxID=996115 RepID=A0A1M5AMH7_9RHOB|nr:hypothetical protein [Ruegeria intermedia]SHF31344.1 hypothetical protein SAMN05444279_1273 [Ruegeria intermedia]
MFMGNTPFITVRAARPLTDIEFCAWVGQATPGDRLEYHRGFLGIDAMPGMSTLPDRDRQRLAALASAAFRACEAGLVHLVQERLGPDRFAYLAIARPKPRATSVPLERLLAQPEAA